MAEINGTTIYDVAKLAGTSISTVSRFLNNPEKVNVETAKSIQNAINQLGYFRHGNAGTKASRQIGRIGVLTKDGALELVGDPVCLRAAGLGGRTPTPAPPSAAYAGLAPAGPNAFVVACETGVVLKIVAGRAAD